METDPIGVEPGGPSHQGLCSVVGELVTLQLLGPAYARPVVLVRRPQHLEYEVEFILDSRAWEERPARSHLVENASDPPHVNRCGVLGGSQEDIWGSVPQGHNLVGVGLGGHRLGAGQAKISQLQLPSLIYQKVLRFEISVQHSPCMAVSQAS